MTILFYFDEDSQSRRVVQPLRARGLDVETAADANLLGHDDADQLAYATAHQRVIVTSNAAHFSALHRQYLKSGQSHCGIVVIHQQRQSTGEVIRRLLRLVGTRTPDDMHDQIVYLGSSSLAG